MDGLRFLGLDETDTTVQVAVLERVLQLRQEERDAMAERVAVHTARMLAQMFRR